MDLGDLALVGTSCARYTTPVSWDHDLDKDLSDLSPIHETQLAFLTRVDISIMPSIYFSPLLSDLRYWSS